MNPKYLTSFPCAHQVQDFLITKGGKEPRCVRRTLPNQESPPLEACVTKLDSGDISCVYTCYNSTGHFLAFPVIWPTLPQAIQPAITRHESLSFLILGPVLLFYLLYHFNTQWWGTACFGFLAVIYSCNEENSEATFSYKM